MHWLTPLTHANFKECQSSENYLTAKQIIREKIKRPEVTNRGTIHRHDHPWTRANVLYCI